MRRFIKNKDGNVSMILAAVVMAIVLAVSVLIVFNVLTTLDITTLDADSDLIDVDGDGNDEAATPVYNASNSLLTNTETFYTIAPIAIIVVAAVGILGYVMMIGGKR